MSKLSIQVVSPDSPDFKPLFDFYVQFFPQIERNTYESLCGYYGKADGIYEYQSIVCKEDDKIVGGCYVNMFKDIHVCFIEFIFVDQGHRGKGIAKGMLEYLRKLHSSPTFMIEVEKDGTANGFWRHVGFSDLDYDYVQPPIVDGNEPFDGLKLMSDGEVSDIDDVLKNHYWKYSFA